MADGRADIAVLVVSCEREWAIVSVLDAKRCISSGCADLELEVECVGWEVPPTRRVTSFGFMEEIPVSSGMEVVRNAAPEMRVLER